MRKFKLVNTSDPNDCRTTWELSGSHLLNVEMKALADLQVGQTYVDSDGDTWERVE